jgi:hypothetical protein
MDKEQGGLPEHPTVLTGRKDGVIFTEVEGKRLEVYEGSEMDCGGPEGWIASQDGKVRPADPYQFQHHTAVVRHLMRPFAGVQSVDQCETGSRESRTLPSVIICIESCKTEMDLRFRQSVAPPNTFQDFRAKFFCDGHEVSQTAFRSHGRKIAFEGSVVSADRTQPVLFSKPVSAPIVTKTAGTLDLNGITSEPQTFSEHARKDNLWKASAPSRLHSLVSPCSAHDRGKEP